MALKKHVFELFKVREFKDHHVDITPDLLKEVESQAMGSNKYPVAKGHLSAMGWFGDDAPGMGYVNNLRYDEENERLLGDVYFTEEMENDYQAGKFSFWSPGISRDVSYEKDNEGNIIVKEHPWNFGHLAMLGSTEAAFKDLGEIATQNFSNTESVKPEIGKGLAHFTKNNKEYILFNDMKLEIIQTSPVNNNSSKEEETMADKEKFAKDLEAFKAEKEAFEAQKAEYEKVLKEEAIRVANKRKEDLFSKMDEKGLGAFKEKVEGLFTKACENFEKTVNTDFADVLEEVIGFMNAPIESGESGQYRDGKERKPSEPDFDGEDEQEYFEKLAKSIKSK